MATVHSAALNLAASRRYKSSFMGTSVSGPSRSVFLSNSINGGANLSMALGASRRGSRNQKNGFSCYCLFGLGVPELVVIAGVTALVFGPKKLPEVGRSIGKTVKSFQQAAKEFESELKKEQPDSPAESPAEQSTTVIEEEKQDAAKVSSMESS